VVAVVVGVAVVVVVGVKMRKVSKKQAELNAEWNDARREFIARVGHCMVCQGTLWLRRRDGNVITALHCHEMIRGTAGRQKSIAQGPVLWMCVCNLCHEGPVATMPIARQIAYKVTDVNDTFSIAQMVNAVRLVKNNGRGPVIVTVEDVFAEIMTLKECA
jgi:hypothetical protein